MTRFVSRPYPLSVIRLSAPILFVALGACATDTTAIRGELTELGSSLRALRAENARLEGRLDKLEQQTTVSSTRRSTQAAAATTAPVPAPSNEAVPPLTVVKLRPRVQAAPKLPTRVEVAEPAETIVDELKPADRPEAEVDAQIADAAYARGLDALKTGNAESGMAQLLQFASDNPRNQHADNALYFVGVALMAQQDFAGAGLQFERVLAHYPAGDSVIDSMLKLGECRLRLKQPQLAKSTWEKLISSFPGTPGAAQAKSNLAALSNSKSQ